ncbi:MAG: ATP-binding cassette domain-containing protein [Oscillospiraceae bacterium]|nr:ATP-binding cassette domain-containing protein [Oscillospiraceae bacterium]
MNIYAVEAESIGKAFGKNVIFENINFQINEGEVISILGPSGEGKSTFLRCLAGLEEVDDGIVKIFGAALCAESKRRKDIGFVFQNFNLFSNLTVRQNLKIAKKSDERADELLTTFGLQGKEDSYPRDLSGGQRQRVAIARALMQEPRILFFDEPTSSLDPEYTAQTAEIIKSLAANNKAVAVVTHNMEFAKLVSKKIFKLKDNSITEGQASGLHNEQQLPDLQANTINGPSKV